MYEDCNVVLMGLFNCIKSWKSSQNLPPTIRKVDALISARSWMIHKSMPRSFII